MRILLSNDDGVHAPGLMAMYLELKKLGEVFVVAPLKEQSIKGHSLTIHKPLRLALVRESCFYSVSGSPADCIYLGINEVLEGIKPDWVVSGINRGANLGQDVYYSGTVSAAREATIFGVSSLAVSLMMDVNLKKTISDSDLNYKAAAKIASQVLVAFKDIQIPQYTLLNLNIPNLKYTQIKGLKITSQGFRFYGDSVLKRKDHRGKDYYWIGGHYKGFQKNENTDCYAVSKGYASLSPLRLDSTDYSFLNILKDKKI